MQEIIVRIHLFPTAYVVQWEGYVLTRVCLSVHRGVPRPGTEEGYPSQVPMGGGTPARSDLSQVPMEEFPGQVQLGGGDTLAGSGWGGRHPRWGTRWHGSGTKGEVPPQQGWGTPCQVRMGGTWGGVPPTRDRVPPRPRYTTADGVLDTLRTVCLLRSRRRTFLLVRLSGW